MQRETYTSWVCERTKFDNGIKTEYYQCNRSGAPRIKINGKRKKDFKGIVSDKTFSYCASFLTVKIVGDQFIPSYCITHTSHEIEVEHLRFLNSFKQEVASKLRMGVRINSILKDIRENTDPAYEQLKNCTRKMVDNIIAKESINQEYKLDPEDAHSVDKFVQNNDRKTVFLYKPCGLLDPNISDLEEKDFALGFMNAKQEQSLLEAIANPTSILCADATHGTSKYTIKLITLMAVNSFGSGVPCAFLFSNREDETVLTFFRWHQSASWPTSSKGVYDRRRRGLLECIFESHELQRYKAASLCLARG